MSRFAIARDGVWTGATVNCSAGQIAHNTPPGCIAIEGDPADLIAAGQLLPRDPAELAAEVAHAARAERDRRLAACDWTQLPDVPAGTAAVWAAYRQELRDAPLRPGWPHNPDWPIPPA